MVEVAWSALILLLLVGGCAAGMALRRRLKEHHRSQETLDSVRMITGMMVTFAALVLGLLVTSVKADFDNHTDVYRRYGASLIALNQRLLAYGPDTRDIRLELRVYTAAAVADTWPRETLPSGSFPIHLDTVTGGSDESAKLTSLMDEIDAAIQTLHATDDLHQKLETLLEEDIKAVEQERWRLVEGTQSKLSPVFMSILVFWLLIIFVVFGILSPVNILTAIIVGMSALSVTSSLYLILDLDSPFSGFITITSQPLRDAVWHMDHDRARG